MIGAAVKKMPYEPRAQFVAFHARGERFAVLVCHRRMGKTVACLNDLIDKAMHNILIAPRYGYIAPFYKQAKDIAWSYLKYYAAPVIEKVMESELSVILKNGALIRLYGADNPDSLRGVYFDGVILDEFGDMAPRLFGEVIAPTLADRKGWVVFIGTPKGPNHFFDLWNKAANDDRWFKRMHRASETGIIDNEELEMLATLPGSDEDTFRQEFECDFHAAIRGAFYGKLLNEIEALGQLCKVDWDPSLPVITGWDLGWSDDTSVWFAQRRPDGIAIIDFFTVSGYSIDDIIYQLQQKPYTYDQFLLPHDAKSKSLQTGKSIREQLWGAGIKSVIVPDVGVQNGIQAVRKTLPKVWFDITNEDVKLGVNALRMYQREWDDRNRIFKQSPKHDWSSNPADAFRMLCLGINPYSAKMQGSRIVTKSAYEPVACKTMNLHNLFADRKNQPKNTRI